MSQILKLIALAFIAVFCLAIWLLVGSYVGKWVPFSKTGEFDWGAALTGSASSLAAATLASPFLVVLFDRRRWLAALVLVAPLLIMHAPGGLSIVSALVAFLYFTLLMLGIELSSRILNSN